MAAVAGKCCLVKVAAAVQRDYSMQNSACNVVDQMEMVQDYVHPLQRCAADVDRFGGVNCHRQH